jgi:hypothetical protein
VVETPLHPHAARIAHSRLIGEAFISLNVDLSQAASSFRAMTERMMLAQMAMLQIQKPLSLITLSGV